MGPIKVTLCLAWPEVEITMANRQLRLSSVQIQPAAADGLGIAVADGSRVRPDLNLTIPPTLLAFADTVIE